MPEQTEYNRIAIEIADEFAAVKDALQKVSSHEAHGPEDLFKDYNRPGLGIALEYERMGSQPVSDALQARADENGYELEHLAITIGTVIHNIDLKHDLSEEKIRFVRDTLLERKVIFFRDQNLSEDEQVTLGTKFGGLDAFPFGNPNPGLIRSDECRVLGVPPAIWQS